MPRLLQFRGLSRLAAYSLSVMDSKRSRNAYNFQPPQNTGEILILIGRALAPSCTATFILMAVKLQIMVMKSGAAMNPVIAPLLVFLKMDRWPQMFVFRKQDWSWEMSNHLFCYTSIPDSDKAGL
ncbi:hypothetical protein ACLB2K_023249 [Fragaria x ananassa]